MSFCSAGVHFQVKDLIELISFGHVFNFLFGGFLKHLKLVDFVVELVDKVVVLVHALVEGLSQSTDGLVHLLSAYEMVLALDH